MKVNQEKKVNVISEKEKEILTALYLIDNERHAQIRGDALKNYNTGDKIHLKQIAFHKCGKRNRWVFGGNRTGKTECGAVETVWTALGNHPYRKNKPNTVGWVVSVSGEVQREVAQSKILKYIPKRYIVEIVMQEGRKDTAEYGVIDYILVKNVFGGLSKICFKTHEQSREKFQGASLDYVWFDEEPPKDIYYECRMRVLDKNGNIWCTMTPLKGLTFVYDEIYRNCFCDKEIWYENIEWEDNPYLDKNEIERLTSAMTDAEIESRKFGHFTSVSGLVYTEFEENIHVIEPFDVPVDWQDGVSIDPGLNNPLSCHFYAVDYDGVIYVVAEHFMAEKDIDYHASHILALADSLNWKRDKNGRLESLIDSAANQTTLASSKSVTELFFERGIACNPKVNKEIFAGVSRLKSLFKVRPPRIYIFNTCTNLIRELKSYWWGKNDVPKKVDDHALDELRYYIMSKPTPHKQQYKKNQIELDKEKLLRNNYRKRFY